MRPRPNGSHLVNTPLRCARPQVTHQRSSTRSCVVESTRTRLALRTAPVVCCVLDIIRATRTRATTRRLSSLHVTQQPGPTRAAERYSVRLAAPYSTFPPDYAFDSPPQVLCNSGSLFLAVCVARPLGCSSLNCASVCFTVAITYEPIVLPFLRSRTANAPRPAPSISDGPTRYALWAAQKGRICTSSVAPVTSFRGCRTLRTRRHRF